MPKQKQSKSSRPRKQRTKRRGSRDLPLYILAGLLCVAAIWFITRPAQPESQRPDTEQTRQSEPDKPPKTKTGAAASDPRTAQDLSEAEADLTPVIISALAELGVTDGIYKLQKRGGTTIFQAPLDKSSYDLYFANMIIKGRVEKAGGKLDTAEESGGRQSLGFSYPGQERKWKLELYYDAKPYEKKVLNKTLAIVVDDFGEIGGDLLSGFLNLPKEVSFAIFPEMKNSISTMERAHAQGRETIIHVPMEPLGYPQVNPGKNAILVQMPASQISKLVSRFVEQMPLCIGINNHMGSLATTDRDVMGAVMSALKDKNKLFLDSRTSNVSVAYQVAQKAHIPAFRNDIFLDSPDISGSTMESKIKQLEALSGGDPHLIAITHCHNQAKLVYLVQFIDRMRKAGYTLVPLSKSGRYHVPEIL